MPGMVMGDARFRPILVTKGRITGRRHAVELLGVMHMGDAYFSRHRPDGDWFRNALRNPRVTIRYDGRTYDGTASMVTDDVLLARISELKYPGMAKAREKRVAIRVVFDDALPF